MPMRRWDRGGGCGFLVPSQRGRHRYHCCGSGGLPMPSQRHRRGGGVTNLNFMPALR